ncbi:unnamed protein product, partial [Hapterophycus canaliculatus]
LLRTGFAELNSDIRRAGGKVVALSSQAQVKVNRASRDLDLPFKAFGDPKNELVNEMNRRRFNMGCTIARQDIVTEAYPEGMAQPCVLAVYGDDRQSEDSVLYKWCQWQTIASMKHADAWAQITKALSSKTEEGLVAESGGGGGGGGGCPFTPTSTASTRYMTPPSTRPRSRVRTPHVSNTRNSSSSSFVSTGSGGGGGGGRGGYAPLAGHQVDGGASGGGGSGVDAPSTATAGATPAEAWVEKPSRGGRAQTIGEAVNGALAVGWTPGG